MAKVIKVQASIRGYNSRKWTKGYKNEVIHAIKVIQNSYRIHFYHISSACREMQRVYRGHRGRLLRDNKLRERRVAAAEKIVKWYKRNVQRIELNRRSKLLLLGVRKIQRSWRLYRRRKYAAAIRKRCRDAATSIQRVFRGYITRKFVETWKIRAKSAAINIQRVFRGFQGRKFFKSVKKIVTKGLTLLQATYRGKVTRKRYILMRSSARTIQRYFRAFFTKLTMKAASKKHRSQAEYDAAVCIQRRVRGIKGRKRAVLFRKIHNAKYRIKGQNLAQYMIRRRFLRRGAVISLQRWRRAHEIRAYTKSMFRWQKFQAQVRIQRNVRGWYERIIVARKREDMTSAALFIQRVYRGYLGRCVYRALLYQKRRLAGAIACQKIVRGFLGRVHFKQYFKAQTEAALLAQKIFRGNRDRKQFATMNAKKMLDRRAKYEETLFGRLENKVLSKEAKYARAEVIFEIKFLKETRHRFEKTTERFQNIIEPTLERARNARKNSNYAHEHHLQTRRNLIAASEAVYSKRAQLLEEQNNYQNLTQDLMTMHENILLFKQKLRKLIAEKRVLEPLEFWNTAREFQIVR